MDTDTTPSGNATTSPLPEIVRHLGPGFAIPPNPAARISHRRKAVALALGTALILCLAVSSIMAGSCIMDANGPGFGIRAKANHDRCVEQVAKNSVMAAWGYCRRAVLADPHSKAGIAAYQTMVAIKPRYDAILRKHDELRLARAREDAAREEQEVAQAAQAARRAAAMRNAACKTWAAVCGGQPVFHYSTRRSCEVGLIDLAGLLPVRCDCRCDD